MAPVTTRSGARGDPGYVFERFTPVKRPRGSKSGDQSPKKRRKETTKSNSKSKAKEVKNKKTKVYSVFKDPAVLKHFGKVHVAGVHDCQETMNSACERLLKLAELIDGFNDPEEGISENVRGDMEAFSGKARLLVNSKFKKQYQKMIDNALDPEYDPPSKVSDLTGFWEMVELQITEADESYDKLLKVKENGWTEIVEEPKLKPAPAKVLKPKVINKPAVTEQNDDKKKAAAKARAEQMKALRAQMKAKMKETTSSSTDENSGMMIL